MEIRTDMDSQEGHYAVSRLLLPEIDEMLSAAPEELEEILEEIHAADLAELTHELPEERARLLLSVLPAALSADVAEYLEDERRSELLGDLPPATAADILEEMAADERADLLSDLEPHEAEAILGHMEDEEREEARQLLEYPETSAGGLMTTEYVTLAPTMTVGQALERIRTAAREERETIYAAFVTDGVGRLMGVLSLRDLLTEEPPALVVETMTTKIISVGPLADQEDVARVISKYDLLAVPVLEPETGRLLGIVTVDDVVDVLVAESTEDAQKMSAIQSFEEPYFKGNFWTMVRKRGSWLAVIFVGGSLTGTALRYYESQLQQAVVLMFFLPLIVSSGGNSGSQSSTLVTRALALREIEPRDFLKVFARELRMGLALGLFLGAVGFARAWMWGEPMSIRFVVAGGILGVVTAGTLVGALLPLGLANLGVDPAVTSAPFIATLVDVLGIVVYLQLARLFLGI
ncbi:MAG: magnesium transporter [Candidatus Wallbacteria bacterium]|nr:magnesium transporter [Candidatus Wallbacteria bacterium]